MDARENRVVGSIMGLAVGDALGAGVENCRAGAIRQAYGRMTDYVDCSRAIGKRLDKWRMTGLYTDDTQQALVLLETCLDRGGWKADAAVRRFTEMTRAGADLPLGGWRGTGPNFQRTALAWKEGKDWREAGMPTAGNGAAMRVAPVALARREPDDAMRVQTLESCLLTHRHVLGVSPAAALAWLVNRLADLGPPDNPAALLKDAAAFVEGCEAWLWDRSPVSISLSSDPRRGAVPRLLVELAERLGEKREEVWAWIAESASRLTDRPVVRPTVGFAPASTIFAIYMALSGMDDPENALIDAIGEGGDADTVGAMTGTLAWAAHGFDRIPERWIAGLANRRQLLLRATALARGDAKAAGAWSPLAEMETALTRKENEEREARMRRAGFKKPEKKSGPPAAPPPLALPWKGKVKSRTKRDRGGG